MQVSGKMKWFDPIKGYGFIVPENGMADIMLHGVVLREGGFYTAPAGARVVCMAERYERGLQATRVIDVDLSTASPHISRANVSVSPASGWESAEVKWFHRIKGFGFLTQGKGTGDIFVHMETLRMSGIDELREGQEVLVRFGHGPKGLMAAELRPVESVERAA